jgi:hypothetical protein
MLLLSACAPTAAPAATQDPALVQQLIEQSVELTVAAQNIQTLEAQALIPAATNTPLPTQTEAASVLPTATPFVIVPPTNTAVPVSGGGGGSLPVVKPDYDCTVTAQLPLDNAVYKPNKDFDINWTIVNTGAKTMQAGLDLKYLSGPLMTNVEFVELPALKPGESYKIILDAKSPKKEGLQVMTWVVEGKLCFPHIAIEVSAK